MRFQYAKSKVYSARKLGGGGGGFDRHRANIMRVCEKPTAVDRNQAVDATTTRFPTGLTALTAEQRRTESRFHVLVNVSRMLRAGRWKAAHGCDAKQCGADLDSLRLSRLDEIRKVAE